MRTKKIAAILLSTAMAVSMISGCGSVDKNATVATLDGEAISFEFANFTAKLQQAGYDDFYVSYFGEKVWSSDLYGTGVTMEESTKEGIIQSIQDMYVLQKNMKEYGVVLTEEDKTTIAETATSFLAANSEEAIAALGATQEVVEEYLTLLTIQMKMYNAMIEDADTNVSDEEANTGSYSYVRISRQTYIDEQGVSAEYTEEELAALPDKVKSFVKEAKEDTLETAAESYGYDVSTGTFTKEDENIDPEILAVLQELSDGEVSEEIETESDYYVVRLDQKTDPEATESTRQTIISQRQTTFYNETLSKWKEEHAWELNEKVWKAVTFDKLFTTMEETPVTEAVSETESIDDTELTDSE